MRRGIMAGLVVAAIGGGAFLAQPARADDLSGVTFTPHSVQAGGQIFFNGFANCPGSPTVTLLVVDPANNPVAQIQPPDGAQNNTPMTIPGSAKAGSDTVKGYCTNSGPSTAVTLGTLTVTAPPAATTTTTSTTTTTVVPGTTTTTGPPAATTTPTSPSTTTTTTPPSSGGGSGGGSVAPAATAVTARPTFTG
ncbi:MAG TPA: hypothetical protein VFW24_08945 [Acidimicrobiales bacterium]|nr:hypothetical protein [Acidimicrobiales bacterium]